MGFHDYVCYIQRNDQCIIPYNVLEKNPKSKLTHRERPGDEPTESEHEWVEYDPETCRTFLENDELEYNPNYGEEKCIGVLLPADLTRKEIRRMNLLELRKYPLKELTYNWDHWAFEELKGYSEALRKKNWVKRSIWRTIDDPEMKYNEGEDIEEWIVNFQPIAYDCFVQEKYEAEKLPYSYLKLILENRNIKILEKFPELDKVEIKEWICTHSHR